MACHGPLAIYVTLRVAHAPGMPGTFTLPPWVSDPDMYHGTCVEHGPWCMPGPLTSGCLLSLWREKRSRYSRRMPNPQFCVSGKRPIRKQKQAGGEQTIIIPGYVPSNGFIWSKISINDGTCAITLLSIILQVVLEYCLPYLSTVAPFVPSVPWRSLPIVHLS